MTTATQPAGGAMTGISDWAGSPMSTLHHMPVHPLPIPVEQYADDTGYVIRLEVPGIDPASDLAVSVETGAIVVRAERHDSSPEGCQTEFRYGQLARRIPLPLGADPREVSASYHDGILTVRIGLASEHRQAARVIEVDIQP
jgi:HSP20 family protein